MPSTIDTESQFKFLISCIKHSSNDKVDFDEVRKECDIVSKGAAWVPPTPRPQNLNIVPPGNY